MDKSIEFKKQGDHFVSIGKLPEAEKYYRNAVSLNPNYTDALVSLGFVLFDSQDYEEAHNVLIKVLNNTTTNPDVYFMLGSIYEAQQNIGEALKNLDLAIKLNPNFQFAYSKSFQIIIKEKNFELLNSKAKEALNIFPNNAEFRFYLAESYYNLANYKESVKEYKKVLQVQPNALPAHINQGNAYFHLEMYFEAMKCYNNTLKIDANSFEAYLGLAKANYSAGYKDMALENYKKCFSINPNNVEININFGDNLFASGNTKDGISYIKKAIAINPKSISAHHSLGNMYLTLKDNEKALIEYKKVLELDPNNNLSYLVASLQGTNLEIVPKSYVESLFDSYAVNFEESLVDNLKYNAPSLIRDVLQPFINLDKLDILDLGCGTGLMGQLLQPSIKSLVGVDLSSKMLVLASEKNVYTRLEKKDILDMMKQENNNSYDIVVSSDVFIYVGNLDLVLPEIFKLLRHNGTLAFSVESLEHTIHKDKNDFYLHQSGRYAHSISYLQKLAEKNGYEIKKCLTQQIRVDREKPVIGHIIAMRKIINQE